MYSKRSLFALGTCSLAGCLGSPDQMPDVQSTTPLTVATTPPPKPPIRAPGRPSEGNWYILPSTTRKLVLHDLRPCDGRPGPG